MEGLDALKAIARHVNEAWFGQWDGRYMLVPSAKHGARAEVDAMKVGSVVRYQCGPRDVLVLDPSVSPISADVSGVLRELRLLPRIDANGVIVTGPRHVLESAAARMRLRGIRVRLHGRELVVGA